MNHREAHLARLNHPDKKKRVYYQVYYARRLGKLKQEPCWVCGERHTVLHHPDYDQPLEGVWLCAHHHAKLHAQYQVDYQWVKEN